MLNDAFSIYSTILFRYVVYTLPVIKPQHHIVQKTKLSYIVLLSTLHPFGLADSTPASVFILPLGDGSQNLTFAASIPSGSDDLYFHLAGPASYAWVAVGTGREMKDSLMFILYSNANGDGSLFQ